MDKIKPKMLEALERNLGVVTAACKECNISRNAFYEWCREDPKYNQEVENIMEVRLDFAESQLLKNIREGISSDIQFFLKKKGKSRGYGDSMDITTDGQSINKIEISIIKKDENS